MAVILAFILILWAWGRFESLAICTGHRNGSKIDFLFNAYYVVARYTRTSRNFEMRFQPAKVKSGLHNFLDFCIAKPVQKSSWTEPRGIVANMEF
ncbi:MAG: hypothetical protein ACD_39C00712G0002 [uncultured bacterium]|nr:MAG: hypothetical protein ACD_39C00712G0002 [uncultured bacterium]